MQFERGWLIGDPHLGHKFEIGVPAHRRGEREARQLQKFRDQLAAPGDMVVMVGDLFDNPYVSHAVVKQAIDSVLEAAAARPQVQFVMMAGNHDVPRKTTATAAFDVFKRACDRRLHNLRVLTMPDIIGGVAFYPWEWGVPALDQVPVNTDEEVTAAVGHWDLVSYGGPDDHLAPVAALRNAFGEIPLYSGHYHTPGPYEVDGVVVQCTGSLEPYSHGEDPEGSIYVTMTREEVLSADPASLKDKCIRVLLAPGEEKPVVDALAIIGKPLALTVDDGGAALSLDKFDWGGIVRKALAPLDEEVRGFIQERLPSHEQHRDSDQAD